MNSNLLKTLLASALITLPGIAGAARWNNDNDAKLPQSSRRVVMMGNSITEYWQWHDVNNHKEFFADNGALDRGIAAEKTPSMVRRFQADVIDMRPLVVVIGGGVNDINAKTPVDEVVANNAKMALAAVRLGIRPIMGTINPSGWSFETVDRYKEYNRKIKAWCEENGFSFCDYFDAVKMNDTQYNEMKPEYRGRADHSDHLHPSRQGYIAMESVLIPLIEMNIWNNGSYEAEYAVKKGSGLTDVTLAAASKDTYVKMASNADTLKLGYNTQEAKGYSFTVTYTATKKGKLAILVNGQPVTVNVKATKGNFSTATVTLNLNQGYNTIAVVNEGNTAVGVDKFGIANLRQR